MANVSDERQKALNGLEEYVKGWKIFIDTCSLLEPVAEQFWKNIIPFLKQYSAKVIIPYRCIQELEKHQNNKQDVELAKTSRNALKILAQLKNSGYIDIRGEKTDNFADNVFNVVFAKFRMKYNLLLITQDRDLAEDLLKLNDSKSVTSAYTIHVKKLNQYGFLSNIYPPPPRKPEKGEQKKVSAHPKYTIAEDEKFELCHQVTNINDDKMKLTHLPVAGESVYVYVDDKRAEVVLKEELGAGGEAAIYSTNTPYVAKVYKEENNTRRKCEKIRLMLSKNIKCEGICYPVAELYNANDEFIGFMMPSAKGKELQRGIFLAKPLFMKNFPGWKKKDTVQLCITILQKIKYLHDRNIIMGDINPANILVVSPTEVYFVDTDSYQVEDFPCPVGTVNYTAPEIQRKRFSEFLRTMGNENFAVATLLFMIMLPGKPPYSQQGGENPIQNIINMNFSYPLGSETNGKTPSGPWRFMWSHLTYATKEAFYKTFRKGEEYSTESTRLDVDDWLALFREYLRLLNKGMYDSMSEDLYPTRFKKSSKLTYSVCKICNEEQPDEYFKEGICPKCLKDGEFYRCSKCGKEIIYTNYQKYIKRTKRYDTCKECVEKGNQIGYTYRCEDCERTVEMTNRECDFYKEKNWDYPKRCKSCRATKSSRNTYSSPQRPTVPVPPPSYTYTNTTTKKNKKSGSFCFLTTAVCEYYGRPDDCSELMALRNYRDNWLRKQPDGTALIEEYYETAPLIVSRLTASEYYPEYCQELWNKYINPCLHLIDEQKYEECKELYSKMFYYMKSEFGM